MEFDQAIQTRCLEKEHKWLGNATYNYKDVISMDMVACYPESFLGMGDSSVSFTYLDIRHVRWPGYR